MKRKVVAVLLAAVFLVNAVPLKTYGKEILSEETKVENKFVDLSRVKEKIKEKAKTLVSHNPMYYDADSVQYAICEGDNVIISDRVGDPKIKENQDLNNNNMYGIGSVSKLYVTAAVMKLVEEKKVDLDLPLINYIKDFKMSDDRYKKITPRMLLNHSSGLMGSTSKNNVLFNDNDTWAHDNLLNELKNQTLKSDPGKFSTYCNDGFTLAEILVERISNMSFTDYLHKYITEPLGLEHTKTPLDDFDRSLLANTFIKGETNKIKTPTENVMVIGTGGIYSSAEDLCRFGSYLVRKDGKGILSPRSVNLMQEKEYLKGLWVRDGDDGRTAYGLCWDSVNLFPFNKYGIKALSKVGDSAFCQGCLITLPELNITMAVTSTGSGCYINQSFATEALLELLKEEGKINDIHDYACLNDSDSQFMPLSVKKDNEGIYNLGTRIAKVNIDEDGTLKLYDYMYGMPMILHYTESGYFINKEYKFGIKFVKEENGKTYMEEKTNYKYAGLPYFGMVDYMGEKTCDNSNMITEAWKKRDGRKYYLINEKYSSVNYAAAFMQPIIKINIDPNGYVGGDKIKNDNEALPDVELPGDIGRDLKSYKFFDDNNTEYLDSGSFRYISSNDIAFIDDKENSIKIDDNGYTKWFKIPDSLDGKTMTVESSAKTSFNIYDGNDECLNDSYVSGNKSFSIKKGELIALAGNPGENFKIIIS